jgi:hypothetical protein
MADMLPQQGFGGLLDFMKTPEGQGLLSAVAGGLAGAKRGAPINTLGIAGLAGLTGYGAAQGRELEEARYKKTNALTDFKLSEATRARENQLKLRDTLPEDQRLAFDANPDGYMATMSQYQVPEKAAARPWYITRGQNGETIIDPKYAEYEKQKAAAGAAKAPANPFYQFLPTADGYVAGNARTGTVAPININGAPVVRATDNPALQGDITRSKETAKADVELGTEARKNVKKAEVFAENAKAAEDLLKKNPTGSGFGAMLDAAGRGVGVSSQSAQTATQLEALGGWMTANVPRMEGPQSNFDVQVYQTMAGKVGDRTVPVAERQAALKTIKGLQEKYKHLNQDALPAATPKPASNDRRASDKPGGILKFDAQGNPI